MPENEDRPRGGGLGDEAVSQPLCRVQHTPRIETPSTYLDLARERLVLHGLARLLVALLPNRSAVAQYALDELVAVWNDLQGVQTIIGKALLRPAGPEVEP